MGNTGSLTKTGHTFAGWNTAANGSGTAYAAGATFNIAANTILYAQWLASSVGISLSVPVTHTFTSVPVGYGAITPLSVTVTNTLAGLATGALTVTLSGANAGSFTLSTGTLLSIAAGGNDSFTVVPNAGLVVGNYSATVTVSGANGITASFVINVTVLATYTVTYNGNGSDGGSVPTDPSSPYSSGSTVTVLGNTGSLTKTSNTFAGWNTASGGSGTAYAPGATFIISADTILYAQWTASSGFTVTFNSNGGDPVSPVTGIASGGTVSVPVTDPSRANFIFGGWFKDNTTFNDPYYFSTAVTSSFTLYARWISLVPEMVTIPPSGPLSFTMGSGDSLDNAASPAHTVTFANGFQMSKYVITQEQYRVVMLNNPSNFQGVLAGLPGGVTSGASLPVEQVAWYDAVEFCNFLSIQETLTPVYTIGSRTPATGYPITSATVGVNWSANGYRLPTEAEWEYACRAGTTTAWSYGGTEDGDYMWYSGNNTPSGTKPVGTKLPNPWGLRDMHGNVREWCWDWYGAYTAVAISDPTGAASGASRIVRGGSWSSAAQNARSAYRSNYGSSGRVNNIGFRIMRP